MFSIWQNEGRLLTPMSDFPDHVDYSAHGSDRQSLTIGCPRLLIVDDDPRALRIFRRILSQVDRHCLTFADAAGVIDALSRNPEVDVVLSDLRMPQTDGIELIRQVRALFKERRWLQFVLVTGQANMDTAISALRLEAVDYLFKPVMPHELLCAVHNAMQRTRRIRSRMAYSDESIKSERLSELARTAGLLAMDLLRVARAAQRQSNDEHGVSREAAGSRVTEDARLSARSCEVLGLLSQLQDEKSRLFGAALPSDAAWEMLTELMVGQSENRRISVTSLCLASKAPVTTALRRIEDLIDAKLVVRSRDPKDRRRSYVELSESGLRTMRQYLVCIEEKLALASTSMVVQEDYIYSRSRRSLNS